MRHRSTNLVGRDSVLRTLGKALTGARAGRGGAVFLIGESGIGKSRLAAAATELAFTSGMGLLRGRASSIGPSAPFRPLTEAILSLLRVEQVEPADLGPYGPILGRLVPEWGAPERGRDGESLVVLAEAVLRLTGLVGRRRGCLLCLDDLDVADPETLAVLEYLVDNIELQPTLLLGAIREEDCAALTLARAAARRGVCELVELDRLPRAELPRLAGGCLDVEPGLVPDGAVELLWVGSAGNPFMVEELVTTMVDDGILVHDAGTWTLSGEAGTALSSGLARPLARRVAQLGPRSRELLSVAAAFGPRFPLAVVQRVTGMSDRDLLSLLQGDLAGQLVTPDEQTADWYAFHHRLSREAVLAQLDRAEHARLAGTLADAVEAVYPGLPGEWCEIAAALRVDAGDRAAAGRLFTEVGRRALALGAATSAVSLLDRALEYLPREDLAERATALELLLQALAEAGLVERALASVGLLDQVGGLSPERRAALHTRLAWAATVAGRVEDGQEQVHLARALLGPDASAQDQASIDVVAAHLALDLPGSDQLAAAERLARQAAEVAESVPLPVVACQALQLLGGLTRHRDPEEATACLERARALAVQHGLPIWEIHALIRLGNDDALRHGDLTRLERAREQASRVGAVTAQYQAEASIALHSVLHGDFTRASALAGRVLVATTRLRLLETTQYVLLVRAVLAAHRGRRKEMDSTLAEFVRWEGDLGLHAPRVHGLAAAFCALLEEDRERALADLARAVSSEDNGSSVYFLSGRYGLHVLLKVLCGQSGRDELDAVTANPASGLRWDRQFTRFADAVLLGRAGRGDAAAEAVVDALTVGQPYAMSQHLGLRLVGEAALADGWGDPVSWLRTAEDHFHRAGVATVASACRALLRRAGARVSQRRGGTESIPPQLRSAGVTAREYEILALLVGRLGNREIADRLHLSPRTVERHVGSLMTKTGLPNRIALGEFAADLIDGAA
ncbi:helix-turn-helix transcriptional regulator [Actinophytocola xanthii]|uniref:LuxR family transcriptional regulator n=1 Tax=Actinophytocola xanthii TaxID=1912961 RepID=A0A1Q8C4I5_9PSEU|nr:LuxR family transcriptional regulator [Actinophytocola xanthii]OLF09257.1 LuxR family transcriptional regulator [Actinophytocola xanthii]